jgi:hypothetical protein
MPKRYEYAHGAFRCGAIYVEQHEDGRAWLVWRDGKRELLNRTPEEVAALVRAGTWIEMKHPAHK